MINITRVQKAPEKRYSVATVSQAIGRSESSINGYFSNRHISVKKGITLQQIVEYLDHVTKPDGTGVRGDAIDWNGAQEIRSELPKYGFSVWVGEITEQLRIKAD